MLDEYAYGTVGARKAGRIRSHIDKCPECEEALADTHLVQDAVGSWPDLPLPEDAFHRLDSRLDFAPAPAVILRPRRFRHLVLPYVAGLATAASLMLLLGNPFASTGPVPASPPAVTSEDPVVADNAGPLPGETVLREVDGPVRYVTTTGEVIEIDEETWHRLNGARLRPVDFETK